MMAGRDGLHEGHHPGDEGDFERPPVCTAEQAQAALEVRVVVVVVVLVDLGDGGDGVVFVLGCVCCRLLFFPSSSCQLKRLRALVLISGSMFYQVFLVLPSTRSKQIRVLMLCLLPRLG